MILGGFEVLTPQGYKVLDSDWPVLAFYGKETISLNQYEEGARNPTKPSSPWHFPDWAYGTMRAVPQNGLTFLLANFAVMQFGDRVYGDPGYWADRKRWDGSSFWDNGGNLVTCYHFGPPKGAARLTSWPGGVEIYREHDQELVFSSNCMPLRLEAVHVEPKPLSVERLLESGGSWAGAPDVTMDLPQRAAWCAVNPQTYRFTEVGYWSTGKYAYTIRETRSLMCLLWPSIPGLFRRQYHSVDDYFWSNQQESLGLDWYRNSMFRKDTWFMPHLQDSRRLRGVDAYNFGPTATLFIDAARYD